MAPKLRTSVDTTLTPLMLRLVPMRGHGIIKGIDDQSGYCPAQDQAREGSLLGREATWGRMLLNGLGGGLIRRAWASASRWLCRSLPHRRIPTYYDSHLFPAIRFSLQELQCPQGIPLSPLYDHQPVPIWFSGHSLMAHFRPIILTSFYKMSIIPNHFRIQRRIILHGIFSVDKL